MLPTDFSAFRTRYPELDAAFEGLARWIDANRQLSHINGRRVASERPDIKPWELSAALTVLVEAGLLRQQFGVRSPTNHALAQGFFDSPEDIPETLYDTAERSFEADDGELVPVYRGAS